MKKRSLIAVFTVLMMLSVFGSTTSAIWVDSTPIDTPADKVLTFDPEFAESGNTASAIWVDSTPIDTPADKVLTFDPEFADIVSGNELARGDKKPTKFFNLSGNTYYVNGSFGTTIYTEYYFCPNADSKLYYNFAVEWDSTYATQKSITVNCYDLTDNKRVTSTSFDMELNRDDSYGPTVYTGNRMISNLSSDHFYYFHISKATDSEIAQITGTISH